MSLLYFLCWLVLIFDFFINHAWGVGARALNMCNYTCRDMHSPLHVERLHKKRKKSAFSVLCCLCNNFYVVGQSHTCIINVEEYKNNPSSLSIIWKMHSLTVPAYCCQEKQWYVPRGQIFTYACANKCKHAFLCTRNDSLSIAILHAIHRGCGMQPYGVFLPEYTHWRARTHKRPRVRI